MRLHQPAEIVRDDGSCARRDEEQRLQREAEQARRRSEAHRLRRVNRVLAEIDATARLAWRFGLTHLSAGDCRKLARLLYQTRRGL